MNASWNVNHECGLSCLGEDRVPGLVDGLVRVLRPAAGHLALHPLVGHHLVHEPEAAQRVGVREQMLEAVRELAVHLPRLADRVQALAAQVLRQRPCPRLLAVEPLPVPVDDRRQPVPELLRARRRQLPHVEHGVDLFGGDLRRLAHRQPRRPHLAGPPRPVGHRPADRAGAPGRELQPVPVLQVQPPQLVVRLVAGVQQRVADRQEHLRPVRRDGQLGLVQPGVDRDLPRRLPVVAQRDLDQPAAALGVVMPVHPQHDLVLERDLRGLRVVEVGDRDRLGDLDRGALVPAHEPLPLGILLGDRLVHAPRRRHRERLQIVGDLAAQPHRRGDHQPALLRLVLHAAVLVGTRPAVIDPGQRDAPVQLGILSVADVGVGLPGVGVRRDRPCPR